MRGLFAGSDSRQSLTALPAIRAFATLINLTQQQLQADERPLPNSTRPLNVVFLQIQPRKLHCRTQKSRFSEKGMAAVEEIGCDSENFGFSWQDLENPDMESSRRRAGALWMEAGVRWWGPFKR